ncbi:hypothetical protein QL285_017096 [Trifolium repens]|nr:hypothetical protein QL285_017096 [Trifolium repens]
MSSGDSNKKSDSRIPRILCRVRTFDLAMRRTLKLSLALTPTRKTEVTTLTPKKMTKTENLIVVIMMLEPPKVRMTMMTTMMMRMITRMMKGMTKMITEMTRKMQAATTQLQAASCNNPTASDNGDKSSDNINNSSH